MPNVKGGSQVNRAGYHNSGDFKKTHKPEYARDDINQAFAGDENAGPFGDSKEDSAHSTNVKSRKTEKSKDRTPER